MNSNHLIGGIHAVEEALRKGRVKKLMVANGKNTKNINALIQEAQNKNIAIQYQELYQLDMLLLGIRHQGVIAECESQINPFDSWQDAIAGKKNPFILILDSIQDPHNLGACLRSACAGGVDAVLIPKDRACEITPVVQKVASGAVEYLAIFSVTNLKREMELMKKAGIWIIGGAGEADKNIYDIDLKMPIALVLGNEGSGIRQSIKEECDYLAKIPLNPEMESLNVSVACGILVFEAVRQRLN